MAMIHFANVFINKKWNAISFERMKTETFLERLNILYYVYYYIIYTRQFGIDNCSILNNNTNQTPSKQWYGRFYV